MVARRASRSCASLAGIKAAGTITLEFTDPANAPSSKIWGEHLTQNTGDEIFWAGHNGHGKLTVYSLKEGSNTYFWREVGISSWANNAPTSLTPDKLDWLAKNFNGPGGNSFPRNGIIGAARSGKDLWFGWTAGTENNFKQAHIEIVALDRNNNFNKTQQVQVWNSSYAFGYPAFSSNGCTGELGMSFEYGDNGNYENHVVGFWGDFIAYITTNSDVGNDRFGDYVTIRRAPISRKTLVTSSPLLALDSTSKSRRQLAKYRCALCALREAELAFTLDVGLAFDRPTSRLPVGLVRRSSKCYTSRLPRRN